MQPVHMLVRDLVRHIDTLDATCAALVVVAGTSIGRVGEQAVFVQQVFGGVNEE